MKNICIIGILENKVGKNGVEVIFEEIKMWIMKNCWKILIYVFEDFRKI